MAWLTAHLPGLANEPLLLVLASVAWLALSLLIIAIPADTLGAVLLAETGRARLGLWRLLRAAWAGTLIQLFAMTAVLFGWTYAVAYAARYAVTDLGLNYEAVESSMQTSIWLVGGLAFVMMAITSILTMIDVQFGGDPTIARSIRLFLRAPFRALGAMLYCFLFTALTHIPVQLVTMIAPQMELPAVRSALEIALATFWATICLFAHYRRCFGCDGAG